MSPLGEGSIFQRVRLCDFILCFGAALGNVFVVALGFRRYFISLVLFGFCLVDSLGSTVLASLCCDFACNWVGDWTWWSGPVGDVVISFVWGYNKRDAVLVMYAVG